MIFPKKIALEYDLSNILRKDDISFSRKYDIFLRTENERWYFSKNTWKYDVFCMLVKVVFLFPTNMKLPFCQKSKDDFFPKNAPKDDISSITEKVIFILEKTILAFSVLTGTFLSVFIYCFPIKKPRKRNL